VTEALARALIGAGLGLREIAPRAASLEQVFSELTAPAGPEGGPAAPPEPARGGKRKKKGRQG
jgi:ABC-2 type transport system ATP-binding protein